MTDHTPRLDHVVLWVRDPLAAADFYEKAIGMEGGTARGVRGG